MKNQRAFKLCGWAFIAVMLVLNYFPLILLVIFSFSNNRQIGDWRNFHFSFELYADLFNNPDIMEALGNTFLIAGVSALLSVAIGTFSAIGIYYLRRRLKNGITLLNQITLVNADIVTGVSLMLFFLLIGLGDIDGRISLIIAHTVITLPYVILSVLPRLSQLNPNLYEAGLDLGAKPGRTLFTVILPQLIPAMLAGFIIAFSLSMDDYVISKFNKNNIETISTLIQSSTKNKIDPAFRALSTMLFALILVVLLTLNLAGRKKRKADGKGNMVLPTITR